jgi:hypothetical protein
VDGGEADSEAAAAEFLAWLEAEEMALADARQRHANRKAGVFAAAVARMESPRTPRGNGIGNAHRVPLHS